MTYRPNQNHAPSPYHLTPFFKNHFIKQLKNKTADDSHKKEEEKHVRMLTIKMDKWQGHILQQNEEIKNMLHSLMANSSKGSSNISSGQLMTD